MATLYAPAGIHKLILRNLLKLIIAEKYNLNAIFSNIPLAGIH